MKNKKELSNSNKLHEIERWIQECKNIHLRLRSKMTHSIILMCLGISVLFYAFVSFSVSYYVITSVFFILLFLFRILYVKIINQIGVNKYKLSQFWFCKDMILEDMYQIKNHQVFNDFKKWIKEN